jgi:hypothetical protein
MGRRLHHVSFFLSQSTPSHRMLFPVLCNSLGTTKALAGSAASFEKIDREFVSTLASMSTSISLIGIFRYVVNSARLAKTDEEGHKQRLLYISVSFISRANHRFCDLMFVVLWQAFGSDASSSLLYAR